MARKNFRLQYFTAAQCKFIERALEDAGLDPACVAMRGEDVVYGSTIEDRAAVRGERRDVVGLIGGIDWSRVL